MKIRCCVRCCGLLVAIVSSLSLAAPFARAGDDADAFAGLLPGRKLTENELSETYGRGVTVSVNPGNENVTDISSPLANQEVIQNANNTGNSGITNLTTSAGDYNTFTNNIYIEVNLNTVEITDSDGSSVQVNQVLDVSGGVVQALGQ